MKFKETKSKKPCMGCPFKRNNVACSTDKEFSHPGNSHPFVYLGQIRGPFWLPCHQDKNYEGTGSNVQTVGQCRGAAIFRANCDVPYKLPEQLLVLPEDKELVFSNESEFIQHYLKMESPLADNLTQSLSLDAMMHKEMTKPSKTRRTYE